MQKDVKERREQERKVVSIQKKYFSNGQIKENIQKYV